MRGTRATKGWRFTGGATLLSLLLLGACARGPDAQRLRTDVQARLDGEFARGVFKIRELKRRGHYRYRDEQSGDPRLLLYFTAEIELLKDYRFTKWDQLNVGALISVLGATPNGVEGIAPAGNSKGDVIIVRGTAAYAPEKGGWHSVAFRRRDKEKTPMVAAVSDDEREATPFVSRLKELAEIGKALERSRDRGDIEALTDSLGTVLAEGQRRFGRSKGWLTIATGAADREYHRQGTALADLVVKAGRKAQAYPTSGSIENCRLVADKEVSFAYAQNDIAHMAFHGDAVFEREAMPSLRAVAALYPEAVQIVALKGSKIHSLADLRGKRVDLGVPGSGGRMNARQLLAAAGLALRDLGGVNGREARLALSDLEQGYVDAVFLTSVFPNPAVFRLGESKPVDIVPLDEATIAALRSLYPFFSALTLPRNTYPGMEEPRLAVQVTAMLLTNAETPDKDVQLLLRQLLGGVRTLSEKGSLQAYFISPKTVRSGLSIPMHRAAEAFLSGISDRPRLAPASAQ